MKHLLKKLLFALVILLSMFILGIFVPMIISLFITMVTESTLADCVKTAPFILFSITGNICSAIYINEQLKDLE